MLYIRHSEKMYRNGNSVRYPLDPGLTSKGRDMAEDKFELLVCKYGVPSRIIASPYLRTRETAMIAQNKIFQITGRQVEIFCASELGEYLGYRKSKTRTSDFTPDTNAYNPITLESWREYNVRLRRHILNALPDTWYITHGVFVQTISKMYGWKIKYPSELEGILVTPDTITLI